MPHFDIHRAYQRFIERLDSLEADTKRCFIALPDGQPAANFSAMLYAMATLDYFSSHWAGWNDSAGDRTKRQTERLVGFMTKYLGYPERASRVAIGVWRHKLMHTGEPRRVRSRDGKRSYGWRMGYRLDGHMQILPPDDAGNLEIQFSAEAFVNDLRRSVIGPGGYLNNLAESSELQSKYDACVQEFASYEVQD